jgi:putative nucleotidyltransferase with HDIG domain
MLAAVANVETQQSNVASSQLKPLDPPAIERRLKYAPSLPSLSSISNALRELLTAEQSYTAQISEIIRRDPSLTSRLLRLVNSVYYGLSTPVNTIEEAVFYLGIRQIRQLAMVTPVIEDFQRLAGGYAFPWREFWQHCIGTAIMTREVISLVHVQSDEGDYVAGLVHDVGKIVMASAFPEHFSEIHRLAQTTGRDLIDIEKSVLGLDHTHVGAMYLRSHNLPDLLIQTAQHHHCPQNAERHQMVVAAVQIANLLVRSAKIGLSGEALEVTHQDCLKAGGWKLLCSNYAEAERAIAGASLHRSLERLPIILDGLV